MDMLAWYIDASKGNVGFSPHRDRQPDDSPSTFRPDGKAKYTTIWIPFTGTCIGTANYGVSPTATDVAAITAPKATDMLLITMLCA